MYWFFLLIMILNAEPFMMEEENNQKRIEIEIRGSDFILGAPIPMKVTYENISDATLTFLEPEKQRSVKLYATSHHGTTHKARFGKVFLVPVNEEMQRYLPEEAENITLVPHQTYEFTCDLTRRFYHVLSPGHYDLQVTDKTDENPRVYSNEISITVNFRTESIPHLMNISGDEKADCDLREWAAEWLKQIKEDFRPQIARPDDPDSIKEGCRTAMASEIDKFRSWWATMQTTEKIQTRIGEINASYFAPLPEEPEEPEEEEEIPSGIFEDDIEDEEEPED